ncbi:hypothetical protein [Roseibium sediminis]|uniref:hypothetical protein n=1 Tax=Roseibium sediminis TaxID=1775174 RepID=UPI00123CCE7F|nr:hypothetical protein [Roseibium sediminis]
MQATKFGYRNNENNIQGAKNIIESLISANIPDLYIKFIEEFGTGQDIMPNKPNCPEKKDLRIDKIFVFSDVEATTSVAKMTKTLQVDGMISPNIMLFAEAYGGHLQYGLILEGPLYGSVVAMDSARLILDGTETEIPNVKGVYHLARTFDEFIDSLYSDPQELEEWEEDFGPLNG